jgi:hypothetical protein
MVRFHRGALEQLHGDLAFGRVAFCLPMPFGAQPNTN